MAIIFLNVNCVTSVDKIYLNGPVTTPKHRISIFKKIKILFKMNSFYVRSRVDDLVFDTLTTDQELGYRSTRFHASVTNQYTGGLQQSIYLSFKYSQNYIQFVILLLFYFHWKVWQVLCWATFLAVVYSIVCIYVVFLNSFILLKPTNEEQVFLYVNSVPLRHW